MGNLAKRSPIFTSDDARRLARKRLPRVIFDFIDGAAGFETTPDRNRDVLRNICLQPRVLEDVSSRTLETEFLGETYDQPFGVSPMGMCALAWAGADKMLAQEARTGNFPVCLSTAGSATIEDMAEWSEGRAWFQLYLIPPKEHTIALIDRAKAAGYRHLVLTVDVPQISRRVRDLRNGFRQDFRIGPRQFLDFAFHPIWSIATLRAGVPSAANFKDHAEGTFNRSTPRTGATWDFLDELRALWPHKLIVKGVTDAKDAERVATAGVDAIWVSNHGGRQLDSAPAAAECLARVSASVDVPLIFDGGVRGPDDILRARALGANFVMMGRPFLFAIGAGQEAGLRSFLDEICLGLDSALAQIGARSPHDVGAHSLVQRSARPHG